MTQSKSRKSSARELLQAIDRAQETIQKLKTLFPELVTEGPKGTSINVDVLKQLVGDRTVTDGDETYGLSWHGKRRARQLALTPATGTLCPCPEDSVDWNTTQNLVIEGDNLEALKLLQKGYANRVKLIYIDPPYNTGKDFVYSDAFQSSIQKYWKLTGRVKGSRKVGTSTDAGGRLHTAWLNMMYPRLLLARSLLRDDGVVFISIDEVECGNLRLLCDEVFGPENFVEMLVWNKRIPKNDKGIGSIHEYVLVYVKRSDWDYRFSVPKEGIDEVRGFVASLKECRVPIAQAESKLRRLYKERRFDRAITLYNCLDDEYRVWGKINLSWPNANSVGPSYDVLHPVTKQKVAVPDRGWRWKRETFEALVDYANVVQRHDGSYVCGKIWFDATEATQPSLIKYLDDVDRVLLKSIISTKSDGGIEVERLFGQKNVMSYPKPTSLLRTLIGSVEMTEGDVVLDFFAGSGTTGHAVWALNAADGGKRRFILVQLPEPLDPKNKEQKTAADFCDRIGKPRHLAELTKERLRRAAQKIRQENPAYAGDLGFRVFRLDATRVGERESDGDARERGRGASE